MSLKAVVLAGLASFASAHIVMTEPVPFKGADGNDLNNSPLEANGSDFPCKMPQGFKYDEGKALNTYKAGEEAPLKFKGTAVHGGGSCQVALTTDRSPDKNSVWKVIHSIEGGCPAQDTQGNLGNDPNAKVPFDYSFTVPEELQDGEYVIAWTWFNNVGNREMYMNCGSAEISGGKGKDDTFLKSLPDLFTANIGDDCHTPANTDLKFPNPGKSVEKLSGKGPLADPTGSACAAKGDSPSNPSTGGDETPTEPEEPKTPKPDNGSGSDAKPTAPGGVFITKAPESGAPAPTGTPETPSVPEVPSNGDAPKAPEGPVTMPETPVENPEEGDDAPAEDAPAKDAPVEDAPSDGGAIPVGDGPSGGFTAGEACTSEGQWNCINGSSFQRCASGAWSQVMALAAGIECQSGQSDTLTANAKVSGKRSLRRVNRLRN